MKFIRTQTRLSAFSIALALGSSAFAETDAAFTKANDQFAQGHFPEAIQLYQELVRSGDWSAALFYNLGNAYFRTADFSHAILNYNRALALEPRHPEATANLAIARDEARALELGKSRINHVARFVTVDQLTILAAATFWITIFAIAVMIINRRRSAGLLLLAILAMTLTIAAVPSVFLLEKRARSLAVVTQPTVQARVATADNANSVLALSGGSEVEILSQRGDWIYAGLPNGLRGWLPAQTVERVRL